MRRSESIRRAAKLKAAEAAAALLDGDASAFRKLGEPVSGTYTASAPQLVFKDDKELVHYVDGLPGRNCTTVSPEELDESDPFAKLLSLILGEELPQGVREISKRLGSGGRCYAVSADLMNVALPQAIVQRVASLVSDAHLRQKEGGTEGESTTPASSEDGSAAPEEASEDESAAPEEASEDESAAPEAASEDESTALEAATAKELDLTAPEIVSGAASPRTTAAAMPREYVIKLCLRKDSYAWDAMKREAGKYHKLEAIQGICIPTLLDYFSCAIPLPSENVLKKWIHDGSYDIHDYDWSCGTDFWQASQVMVSALVFLESGTELADLLEIAAGPRSQTDPNEIEAVRHISKSMHTQFDILRLYCRSNPMIYGNVPRNIIAVNCPIENKKALQPKDFEQVKIMFIDLHRWEFSSYLEPDSCWSYLDELEHERHDNLKIKRQNKGEVTPEERWSVYLSKQQFRSD